MREVPAEHAGAMAHLIDVILPLAIADLAIARRGEQTGIVPRVVGREDQVERGGREKGLIRSAC